MGGNYEFQVQDSFLGIFFWGRSHFLKKKTPLEWSILQAHDVSFAILVDAWWKKWSVMWIQDIINSIRITTTTLFFKHKNCSIPFL